MKRHLVLFVMVMFSAACIAASAFAEDVRLNGATTVIDRVIAPHKDAVEKKTGYRLEIVGNATGKGLVDLEDGRCDASLVSEPLDIALAAAKVAGKTIDPKTLKFHIIMHDEIVFIVNPLNPVNALTWEQLRDIHTGKIKNWKEVGGKDMPITVYSDTVTGGTRAMVKGIVMGGAEYADSVKALTAVRKVADAVKDDPSGVGGLGKGFVNKRVKVLETKKVERPLGIVTIGEPSPKVKNVIDAFSAAVKGGA
jgi:phosphate transport system substrate-binding protein